MWQTALLALVHLLNFSVIIVVVAYTSTSSTCISLLGLKRFFPERSRQLLNGFYSVGFFFVAQRLNKILKKNRKNDTLHSALL